MKFTCDSCGAQYLIADDKIGPRGVKVRCKKCSHVIILRPEGFGAEQDAAPKAANGGERGPMLGGSASTVPVAPSVAAAAQSSALPDQVVAATSSDLGLSQEFRALGFDEQDAPAPRAATLSVGLDLDSAPGTGAEPSPFASERAGGSLDLVQPENASEATAVQPRPAQPFGDEATEMIGEDRGEDRGEGDPPTVDGDLAADPAADLSGSLGVAAPPQDAPEDDEDVSTRVESLSDLAAAEGTPPSSESEDDGVHVDEDETQAADSPFSAEDWAGEATRDAISPAVKDPAEPDADDDDAVESMRGSLEAELGAALGNGLGAGLFEPGDDEGDDGPRTEVGAAPSGPHALAALADDEDEPGLDTDAAPAPAPEAPSLGLDAEGEGASATADGEPAPDAPVPAVGGADGIGTGLIVTGGSEGPFMDDPGVNIPPPEDDSIAQEIGSAFEAMFGGESPEDDLAALQEALGGEETNKAETRVFDTEAMATVEAEQERAAADEPPAGPETKEWFVAIEEEQVGPMSESEVREQWDAGKLQADSLCWRAGMGDWMPISETEPLAKMVPPAPQPRVPTVIGADEPRAGAEAADDSEPEAQPDLEASEPAPEPPKIEPQPEPEPAPRAASEPAWRPSAASALASLAAEELSAPDEAPAASAAPLGVAPAQGDLAAAAPAGALPASDALEKLLEGEPDKSAASQFGAAEQSESAVRPLPRRADTVSSLPLRDPTTENKKSNWVLPASIIGGCLLLGFMVLGGIQLLKDDKPAAAPATTPPGAMAAVGGAAKPGLVETPPATVTAEAEAEAKKKAEAEAKKKAEADAAEAEAQKKADAEAKALAEAEAEKKAVKKKKPRRSRRRSSRRSRRAAPEPAPQPEPTRVAREPVAEVKPAPRPRRGGSVEDDLLGAAKPKKMRREVEPEPALPDQLDDADVLKVLRSKRGDVRRCLEKQASADPSLEGTMTLELIIRRSGRPKGVKVREDKFKRSAVGTCLVAAVKRWRFPKFSGASMPLDFPVRVRAR